MQIAGNLVGKRIEGAGKRLVGYSWAIGRNVQDIDGVTRLPVLVVHSSPATGPRGICGLQEVPRDKVLNLSLELRCEAPVVGCWEVGREVECVRNALVYAAIWQRVRGASDRAVGALESRQNQKVLFDRDVEQLIIIGLRPRLHRRPERPAIRARWAPVRHDDVFAPACFIFSSENSRLSTPSDQPRFAESAGVDGVEEALALVGSS